MSVVQLPKYDINGLSADEEATRLHFRKNQPDPPEMDFPPYRYYPYPACVYREDPQTGEIVSQKVGVFDCDEKTGGVIAPLRDQNERQYQAMRALGWVEHPDKVRKAKDRANKAIALAAAERAYDDRLLGERARAEFDAIDAVADDHVLDVPAPKKRGRPKQTIKMIKETGNA